MPSLFSILGIGKGRRVIAFSIVWLEVTPPVGKSPNDSWLTVKSANGMLVIGEMNENTTTPTK